MKALGIITLGGILFVRSTQHNGYFDEWRAQEGSTVWRLTADKTMAVPFYELFRRDETQPGRELWTRLFASSSLDKISDYMDKEVEI